MSPNKKPVAKIVYAQLEQEGEVHGIFIDDKLIFAWHDGHEDLVELFEKLGYKASYMSIHEDDNDKKYVPKLNKYFED